MNYARINYVDILPIPGVEDHSTILSAVREVTGEEIVDSPMFCDWTRPELFEYFKDYLQPQEEPTERTHFASFTIAVIEEQCLDLEHPGILITTSAPDLEDDLSGLLYEGEGPVPDDWEPKWPKPALRTFIAPLWAAMPRLMQLENLTSTYTEVTEQREWHLSVYPPAWMVAASGKRASPEVAWKQRCLGLAQAVKAEKIEALQAEKEQALTAEKEEASQEEQM